jgi:hypothetical protein
MVIDPALQSQMQKKLIDDLGIGNLSEEQQNEIIIKVTEVLLKRIFLETMEKLDGEAMNEYDKMVENGASAQQIEDFFKSKISNYEEMVQKVIDNFKEEMKQGMNASA